MQFLKGLSDGEESEMRKPFYCKLVASHLAKRHLANSHLANNYFAKSHLVIGLQSLEHQHSFGHWPTITEPIIAIVNTLGN